jgi:hypothetical protein
MWVGLIFDSSAATARGEQRGAMRNATIPALTNPRTVVIYVIVSEKNKLNKAKITKILVDRTTGS